MYSMLRARISLRQLSLRGMFLATTLAGIYLGCAAWKDAERRQIIATIETGGEGG